MITMKLEGGQLATKALYGVVKDVNNRKKLIKDVMVPAAKIVTKVMREKAPMLSSAPVFNVYRTPKLKKGIKAPRGMGQIYAAIKPGQLKKSIFHFHTPATRRAGAINVGPRYKRGVWIKPEKGGWYMHMVQAGTAFVKAQPFVLPALIASSKGVGNKMQKDLSKMIKSAVNANGQGVLEYVG